MGQAVGTCAKFSEKLTFLTIWHAHLCKRVSGGKKC